MKKFESENDLVLACLKCRPAAQRALYDKYVQAMYNTVYRYTFNHHDTQDILQNGFTRVFKHLKNFDENKGDLLAWIRKIHIRCALDFIKKKQFPFEEIIESASYPDIYSVAYEDLEAEYILKFIEELNPRDRVIFNMYQIEGYSHEEIAELLSININSSRVYLARGEKGITGQNNVLPGTTILSAMRNKSELFDQLPQYFDREAIWEGIEKPKRRPFFQIYFWGASAVIVFAALFFLYFQNDTSLPGIETPSASMITNSPGTSSTVVRNGESPVEKDKPQEESIATLPATATNKYQNRNQYSNDQILGTASGQAQTGQVLTIEVPAPENVAQNAIPNLSFSPDNTDLLIKPLPSLLRPLETKVKKVRPVEVFSSYRDRKRGRQSLALRGSIGMHRTRFTALNEDDSKWRSDLERPQVDYGFGLRYEHVLRRDFFVSLTANYNLYKEQINTDLLRQLVNQDVQVEYRLYNHYSVFAGQLEVGKRFYQRAFFLDLNVGAGLNLHQIYEVDYFVGKDQLAAETQIRRDYQHNTNAYLTGGASIGTYLGQRLFVRAGTQFNSGFKLTTAKAKVQHRITPFNAYLEIGMRF